MFSVMCKKATWFRTTRILTPRARTANLSARQALDLPIAEAKEPGACIRFKGNMDTARLEETIERSAKKIPLVMLTVTNNPGRPAGFDGKYPRSEIHLQEARNPLYIDACRFAENAYFIKLREPGYEKKTRAKMRGDISHADRLHHVRKKKTHGQYWRVSLHQ